MPDFTPFFVSGLATAATYVLSAVGIVVLYRASGVVNFSQGALGALAAFVSWSIVEHGGPEPVAWCAGILVSTALAFLYGRVLAPRLAFNDPVMRAVATLSVALILLGLMGYVWGELPRRLRLPTDTMSFELMGVRVTATRAVAFALAVLATVAVCEARRLLDGIAREDDLGAEMARVDDLHRRCVDGHDDRRGNCQAAGVIGYALRVVTSRHGDYAPPLLIFTERA